MNSRLDGLWTDVQLRPSPANNMEKKLIVWVDNGPGGIDWDMSRTNMARVYAKRELPHLTKATLIIHSKKKTSKKAKL